MVGIYSITSPSDKIYIGQSWNIEKRKGRYSRVHEVKSQRKIYNSLVKYGWLAHKFETLLQLPDDTTQEWMDYWEQFFITYYRSEGYELLNLREGGSRGKASEETKQKMSASLTGKNTGTKNYFYGFRRQM